MRETIFHFVQWVTFILCVQQIFSCVYCSELCVWNSCEEFSLYFVLKNLFINFLFSIKCMQNAILLPIFLSPCQVWIFGSSKQAGREIFFFPLFCLNFNLRSMEEYLLQRLWPFLWRTSKWHSIVVVDVSFLLLPTSI